MISRENAEQISGFEGDRLNPKTARSHGGRVFSIRRLRRSWTRRACGEARGPSTRTRRYGHRSYRTPERKAERRHRSRLQESARAEALRPLTGAPFDGVPFLAKDLSTSWKGLPSTNSCQYMADYVSPADSEVVRRTRLAGFITLGKTNVPENGWCLSTEPPFRGVTHNPWDENSRRRGVQRRQRSRGRCRHTADCGRVRRRGLDSCAGCG